ncbi:MAG: FlgD immunoglobulin-like domain containing protein [bacterium]
MQTPTGRTIRATPQTASSRRRLLSLATLFLILTLSLTTLQAWAIYDAHVTFDLEPLFTEYGPHVGHAPGDTVLTENGIIMTIENYHEGGSTSFGTGLIDDAASMGFGQIRVLELIALAARFHFADLPGNPPDTVSFDYLTTNMAVENLDVNGIQIEVVWFSALNGMNVAPGVSCQVTSSVPFPYSETGTVTLIGDIETVQVGGRELQIDNLHYRSTGSGHGCADCDYEVTHETLTVGDAWGAPHGDMPGDLAFVEDGIPVRLQRFHDGGGGDFNECIIEWTASGFGVDNFMHFDRIDVSYEIHALGLPVQAVLFLFADMYDSVDNMQVNGGPMHIGDIESFPTNIAPGITYLTLDVVPIVGGGVTGIGLLLGNVQRLVLGGELFYVDEVCVYTDEIGSGEQCDHFIQFEDEPLGTGYGVLHGDNPGDHIFTEDAIPVSVDRYTDGSSFTFDNCTISNADPGAGATDGQAMGLYGISNVFDFSGLSAAVDTVIFEYVDYAGIENLGVGGPSVYYGQMADFAPDLIPGVTIEVDSWPLPTGESAGRVTMTGNIPQLRVGGQQLLIDNICVILVDGTLAEVPLRNPKRLLDDPFPNPLNPATTLSFSLPSAMPVRLSIYNVAGERIATLMDERCEAGTHSVVWDGRNTAGRLQASGIYFARIEAAGIVEAKKLMLLK